MAFLLRTERLLLRPAEMSDAQALRERRNDADVARWQFWSMPYTMEQATELLESAAASAEPETDSWFMITVVQESDGVIVGDLALHLTWEGRCAEVGYTFDRSHWGKGYAVEAVTELVRWLFEEQQVTRVSGQLHPENVASAQVLERSGFVFEGHTRLSFWVGDENSDDWFYGLTKADWETWRDRPRNRPAAVRLIEMVEENLRAAKNLRTHKSQERMVTTMAGTFADALIPEEFEGAPVVPWYRLIEADGEVAGFVMMTEKTEAHPEPYLWRLLIDRVHQRRGIGTEVLELISDVARDWGAKTMAVSYVEGRGSPEPVYERFGFVRTGEIIDGEIEARLTL